MSVARRWFWRILAGIFCLGVVLLLLGAALAAHWRHIPLAANTTRIIGPLAPDGLPDYLKALNEEHARGLTPENNAAPGVVAVVGIGGGEKVWHEALVREMGIADPGEGTLERYEQWLKARRAATAPASAPSEPADAGAAEDELRSAGEGVWRAAEHGELAAYLESQGAALDELEKALQRDRFYIPSVTVDGHATTAARPAMMPALGGFRYASQVLAARAMLRLGRGDGEGFARDVLGDLTFAQRLVQQPSVIEYLVALSVRTTGLRAVQAGAASGELEGKWAAELRNKIIALEAWPTPARCVDISDRYMMLDAMCCMAVDGSLPGGSGGPAKVSLLPINFPRGMERVNALYDQLRDALNEGHFADQQRAVKAVEAEAARWGASSVVYKATHAEEMVLAIMMPSLKRTGTLYEVEVMDRRLAEAALALRVYRAERGTFPATVAEAGVTGEAGVDGFTEKPLVYRKEGEGYVLYSVGEDLKDDGGKARGKSVKRTGWDLMVRAMR
jgi:hypothetical protein